MTAIDIVFAFSAIVCLITALCIVSRKNPVYSVVYMLPFFLGMTVIFILLQATFLAAIQMIVYGGAILVVFLFVIMLINLQPDEIKDDFNFFPYALSAAAASALAAVFLLFVRHGMTDDLQNGFSSPVGGPKAAMAAHLADPTKTTVFGSIGDIAIPLFKSHAVPFELASILIVVAILGAVLLSKKRV